MIGCRKDLSIHLNIAVLWFLLLTANCSAAQNNKATNPCSSPELILQRYVDAIGGKTVIENLQTRKAEVEEFEPYSFKPQDTATYNYEFTWKAPNKVVVKYTHTLKTLNVLPLPFRSVTFKFDGSTWSDYRGRSMPPQRNEQAWRKRLMFDYPHNARNRIAADPLMIARSSELYSNYELAHDSTNDSSVCVVAARGLDGRLDRLHFDAVTGLLTAWELQMVQPRNSFYITFRFDDYRQTGAVKFPFTLYVDYYKATFYYTKVTHNVALSDSDFKTK